MHGSGFRVLLVGAGEQAWESRGPSIQALAAEDVSLVAVASPGERRRAETAGRLGLERAYASMAEALAAEPIDGVVLAAPNRLHEPLALDALEAGCHVLVEKPMALDAAAGRRMIAAARRAGRILVVGYQYPWMQPALTELAAVGGLDTVFQADGRWLRSGPITPRVAFWDRTGAGAAGDLMGHLLSVILIGIAGRPVSVVAHAWDHFGHRAYGEGFKGHDTLEALVAFEGEVTAHLLVAWDRNMTAEESIGVSFDGVDRSLEVPLMGRELDVERFAPRAYRRVGEERVATALTDPPPVQTEETFVRQARDWVRAARDARPPRFGVARKRSRSRRSSTRPSSRRAPTGAGCRSRPRCLMRNS